MHVLVLPYRRWLDDHWRRALVIGSILISLVLALFLAVPIASACSQALVRLPGVQASDPRLNALAAASFAQVRQEIIARTGHDVLATLADVLRAPGFRSDRPGVADRSWHQQYPIADSR